MATSQAAGQQVFALERLSSSPILTLKNSVKSFPAFRLKKSYWQKQKVRDSTPNRERVTLIYYHKLPSFNRKRTQLSPLSDLVTVSQERKGYESLSRLRRSAAESSENLIRDRVKYLIFSHRSRDKTDRSVRAESTLTTRNDTKEHSKTPSPPRKLQRKPAESLLPAVKVLPLL